MGNDILASMQRIFFVWKQRVSGGVATKVLRLVFVVGILGLTALVLVERWRMLSFSQESVRSGVAQMFGGEQEPLVPVLPMQTDPKAQHFEWSSGGKKYAIDTTLYASTYQFYRALPTGVPLGVSGAQDREWWAALDTLFVTPAQGDETVAHIAQAIRSAGERQQLSDNKMVELVAAFVQSIPYDQMKTDRRASGQDGETEKTTYPYEVLYEGKGVCQDKSYLAYALLRELGYGVALFLFPDPADNHMAVGVACPAEYANYDSGYCFLETTGKGNKIGIIPSLIPGSRVATADIALSDGASEITESHYQTLGRVEIVNTTLGKEYTGIVDTLKTRDTLARLKATINTSKQELQARAAVTREEEATLSQWESKMAKLKRQERYDEYNDLVKPYNRLVDTLERHVAEYNALVEKSNALVKQYNTLSKNFYQS